MTWIDTSAPPRFQWRQQTQRHVMPDRTWLQCQGCQATLFRPEAQRALHVCPQCGHHGPLGARARLDAWLDPGSATDIAPEVHATDRLGFTDSLSYAQRLEQAALASGESDALLAQSGFLDGRALVVACFEYAFMGGSMGSVVGERFAAAAEVACERSAPFVCVTASGGARMQEGLFSLMQMARTAAAVAALRERHLPFITVLTHPTMGGVSASFAFLADVVIAEPQALIGFAGPRVIEQTVRQSLPVGFQRAEFLMQKGAVDLIVDRRDQRAVLCRLLALLMPVDDPHPCRPLAGDLA